MIDARRNRLKNGRYRGNRVMPAQTVKSNIIFIHGLSGESHSTWGRFPEFLMSNSHIAKKFDISFYKFPTSIFRFPFIGKIPKIQELANGLGTQIDHDEYNDVILICHSLGGLIARKYITDQIRKNRPLKVSKIVLLAVPNNGNGLAVAASHISWKNNQLKQLCYGSDIIELLNEDWAHMNIADELQVKYVIGTQDKVVDRFSVAGFWGNPDVETITGVGHINIVKPVSKSDLVIKVVERFILRTPYEEKILQVIDRLSESQLHLLGKLVLADDRISSSAISKYFGVNNKISGGKGVYLGRLAEINGLRDKDYRDAVRPTWYMVKDLEVAGLVQHEDLTDRFIMLTKMAAIAINNNINFLLPKMVPLKKLEDIQQISGLQCSQGDVSIYRDGDDNLLEGTYYLHDKKRAQTLVSGKIVERN